MQIAAKTEEPNTKRDFTKNPEGSVWHRWDPHIHTPETILNDQFNGEDPWNSFLSQIESSDPQIRALGIIADPE